MKKLLTVAIWGELVMAACYGIAQIVGAPPHPVAYWKLCGNAIALAVLASYLRAGV